MEKIAISLCPACAACPEVIIEDSGVRIGEDDNMVRLTYAEWNQLVTLIRNGKLQAIGQE
jgi:hypothetical protein